jgi:copper chaperone CopZ
MLTTLRIDGMRSAHCARAVYTALAMVPGVAAAEVVVGRATLEHDAPLDVRAIEQAVTLAGYTLRDVSTDRRHLTTRPDSGAAPPPSTR